MDLEVRLYALRRQSSISRKTDAVCTHELIVALLRVLWGRFSSCWVLFYGTQHSDGQILKSDGRGEISPRADKICVGTCMWLVTFCVSPEICVLVSVRGRKKTTINNPTMSQRPPSGSLHPRCLRLFFFSFPFTHSHIYKPVTMNAWISSRAFQNKTLNSTRVYVIAFIFERGFAQLPANGRLVSSLAWRRAPTPPSSSSPPLNAEFGARKALSAADNGGSGCCGRAGRCNFSRLLYQRPHLPFKLLRGVERASL